MKRRTKNISQPLPLLISLIISVIVGIIAAVFRSGFKEGLQHIWGLMVCMKDNILIGINWLISNSGILWVKCLLAGICVCFFSFPLTWLVTLAIRSIIIHRKVRKHFKYSSNIIKGQMIPAMKYSVLKNEKEENLVIDSYIQSPIEYADEIVEGNQAPKFDPDDTYQDVLYDNKIKFILAITSENPNMFLDPTIGFYMSNCYASSLIRHTNDFIKNTKSKPNSIPQLLVKDLEELEEKIKNKRQKVIDELKQSGILKDYEFIRIVMYNERQSECCDNAVFPSLKASQDLFRTLSFYLNKENMNNKDKWESLCENNEKLWSLFDRTCNRNPKARAVREKRIADVVPEFLFVFYDKKIGIHTYLGGEYCKRRVDINSDEGNYIIKLIKILAGYVDEDVDKGQLSLGEDQNEHNTFIDWEWVN